MRGGFHWYVLCYFGHQGRGGEVKNRGMLERERGRDVDSEEDRKSHNCARKNNTRE